MKTTTTKETATADHPLHELIAERCSPRAFADRPLDEGQLGRPLESARWAPSCFGDQPWSFVVGREDADEAYAKLAGCLVPANAAWATAAPVLMLSAARLAFAANGEPNRHAKHYIGLATASLVLQAEAFGLGAHLMAGFDAERARAEFAIPDGHEPPAMIAVGHPGPADQLPPPLREREEAARERKPLADLVFGAAWGLPNG